MMVEWRLHKNNKTHHRDTPLADPYTQKSINDNIIIWIQSFEGKMCYSLKIFTCSTKGSTTINSAYSCNKIWDILFISKMSSKYHIISLDVQEIHCLLSLVVTSSMQQTNTQPSKSASSTVKTIGCQCLRA